MKLDLGCGTNKHPHFTGLDLQPLPEVDLVSDMNERLPLPDHSVEFIMASRSLPYVLDLPAVLSEMYRVCTHKAIVCILAPYAHNFRHLSNPFLKQKFDESTPRYMTNHFFQPASGPACPPETAYTARVPYDFRLLRMELFYQTPYEPPMYDKEELDLLRSTQTNVVHEIMYHFLVVKNEISEEEVAWFSRQEYPEPICLKPLRAAQQAKQQSRAEELQLPVPLTDEGAEQPKARLAVLPMTRPQPRTKRRKKQPTPQSNLQFMPKNTVLRKSSPSVKRS
jgi:SAM-dependent methyltransferase